MKENTIIEVEENILELPHLGNHKNFNKLLTFLDDNCCGYIAMNKLYTSDKPFFKNQFDGEVRLKNEDGYWKLDSINYFIFNDLNNSKYHTFYELCEEILNI